MKSGLDGVVVAETVLSHSDAQLSRLWIRGVPLDEAVRNLGYEGTVALLWSGFASNDLMRDRLVEELALGRRLAFERLDRWLPGTKGNSLSGATRQCLAAMPDGSTPAEIASALAVGVAALSRFCKGLPPIKPDATLTTAADFLRMMNGEVQGAALVNALDTYFTVTAENGLGPSTFAARVAASTGATLVASALAAYCAFEGPLHGGAPGPALAMLDEAQASGDPEAWLSHKLVSGGRLPGFGNRAFPNGDPRALLLAEALHKLGGVRAQFAAEFERFALAALARHRPGRSLRPNLEIYAALLLEACGIPRDAFTPTFATARVTGWLACSFHGAKADRSYATSDGQLHWSGAAPRMIKCAPRCIASPRQQVRISPRASRWRQRRRR